MPSAQLFNGDCLDVLRSLPDESVHAVVTDPPYGLSDISPKRVAAALTAWATGDRDHVPDARGFMGWRWDAFVPPPAMWDEVLRVLKPGGHLVCFAGSRTHDMMGLSIRLAGFEIRDSLAWLYGSGMPKGHNLKGDWAGWSTGLKPAFEPITLARKPFPGGVARNVREHGTGALNTGACRIPHASDADRAESEGKNRHADYGTEPGQNTIYGDTSMLAPKNYNGGAGRWPANVVLDESQATALDKQSGASKSSLHLRNNRVSIGDGTTLGGGGPVVTSGHADTGGASRFFYCPKAPKSERPIAPDGTRHPTVKPLALMQWLVRLVTPPGGIVLDPFAGSGTTLEAAILEGFDTIGVERNPAYLPLIEQRIARATLL